MRYHLVAIDSDIAEDDFEQGEGESTGCGYSNEPVGRTFDTLQDMLKYLASTYGLSDDEQGYEVEADRLETTKTVANHSEEQNGGWFAATEEELAAWKRGKLKLYSENYTIRFVRCV